MDFERRNHIVIDHVPLRASISTTRCRSARREYVQALYSGEGRSPDDAASIMRDYHTVMKLPDRNSDPRAIIVVILVISVRTT